MGQRNVRPIYAGQETAEWEINFLKKT
ncbi:hypothetical protein ACFSL6_21770 [Paenibacillus thailandensis]